MRLISTLFIICLFGKLINCNNNNNDQNNKQASSNDKQVVASASNQAPQQLGPESRQISAHPMSSHMYSQYADASSPNINVYTNNLSPKESAHSSNQQGLLIQPQFAPFGTHQPDSSPTTSFIRFIKPEKETAYVGRRSSLTNRLKNFMSSLFWKESLNPYMTSGSSYSFALKQPPPFNFQNQAVNQAPSNYASLASASQYKPMVFGNYPQAATANSNNFNNKYTSSFNPPQYGGQANAATGSFAYASSPYSNGQQQPNYPLNHPAYLNSNINGNINSNLNSNTPGTYSRNNNNNLNSNLNTNLNSNNLYASHGNTGFPPSSYQVAAASNVNPVYANNQYSSANTNNQQQDAYNYNSGNQRLSSAESSVNAKQTASNYASDSSSSSSNSNTGTNSLPLTSK